MTYRPEVVYLDQEVEHLPITGQILSRLEGTPVDIAPAATHKEHLKGLQNLTQGKRILHLKAFHGSPLKICPGFTSSILCCNYHVIDLVENCPLECTYCILQAFLNQRVITLHVNVEEILDGIGQTLAQRPNDFFRIGTGEHSDSLAMDHLFGINPLLVERFAKFNNACLELKTKTNQIESLLPLKHGGNTLIGWSMNPPELIKTQEFKTASLTERLEAAKAVVDAGYKVSFHFDPLIHYPGWEEGYAEVVEGIFSTIEPTKIAWISMGTLRYIPSLKQIAEERFKGCNIFQNEFIPAEDGKMKYLKAIRRELTSAVARRIERLSGGKTPLYLCMEKKSVWKDSISETPEDTDALEVLLQKNL